MKRWQKIALGAVCFGIGGMIIKTFIEEDNKRHYSSMKMDTDISEEKEEDNENPTDEDIPETIKEKVNNKVTNTAAEVVIFVNNHKSAFEAATIVAGFVPIALNTITAIKDFKNHNDILDGINDIKNNVYTIGYNDCLYQVVDSLNHCTNGNNAEGVYSISDVNFEPEQLLGKWIIRPYTEEAA